MDEIIPMLMAGSLEGEHLKELESAIEIAMNKKLEAIAHAEERHKGYLKKLALCLVTAKEFLHGRDSVTLSELQDAAANTNELTALGLLVGRNDPKLTEIFSADGIDDKDGKASSGGDLGQVIDNYHFLVASDMLGDMFCECMAVQAGKTDEWIADKIVYSDRGTPRIQVNSWRFAQWNADVTCELAALKKAGSCRAPIYEALCRKSREALEEALSHENFGDDISPPGEQQLKQMVRVAVSDAAKKLHLQLPRGFGVD